VQALAARQIVCLRVSASFPQDVEVTTVDFPCRQTRDKARRRFHAFGTELVGVATVFVGMNVEGCSIAAATPLAAKRSARSNVIMICASLL